MTLSTSTPDMYARLQILQQYRHIAIVGISADPYRPSHFVAIYLQAEGYDIIPINPR
ncbi:MAG TPA: CoA-binding protein, partial [Ktedonobacter sp.]|nr:CoA-binding protein [Ktedonobacter sp.]